MRSPQPLHLRLCLCAVAAAHTHVAAGGALLQLQGGRSRDGGAGCRGANLLPGEARGKLRVRQRAPRSHGMDDLPDRRHLCVILGGVMVELAADLKSEEKYEEEEEDVTGGTTHGITNTLPDP
jgi:hypothetical protein